jgi:phosphopantothenoylcysteine decarboxylase / phosphopantothenate---cysteine ligase
VFRDKKILLGVTGSIAAYKAAFLAREFVKHGALIRVCLTKSASQFITPLTFQTISGYPVITDMWQSVEPNALEHISWTRWADTLLIAPASANIIGKAANGIADDYLSTAILSTTTPVIFAPAMNSAMFEKPIFQQNVEKLRALGYQFVESATGELACGESGVGRLAEIADILDSTLYTLNSEKPLQSVKILVTAGATREYLDPVRYLSNPSTGKMGFELARSLTARGATVDIIAANVAIKPPYSCKTQTVSSADEMFNAVFQKHNAYNIIVMTAAVSDFTFEKTYSEKMKKNALAPEFKLQKTKDILLELGKKPNCMLVGFALETENMFENALEKLRSKNLDLIIANLEGENTGFGAETNSGLIIDKSGIALEIPLVSKRDMAEIIADRIANKFRER